LREGKWVKGRAAEILCDTAVLYGTATGLPALVAVFYLLRVANYAYTVATRELISSPVESALQ